jgi:hypothetical protein
VQSCLSVDDDCFDLPQTQINPKKQNKTQTAKQRLLLLLGRRP